MAYATVLVVAVLNSIVLFFAAFLAAGGDGNSDGVKTVWFFGYLWIALLTAGALALCARNKGSIGVVLAISTLPSAYLVATAALMFGVGMVYLKPASSEFTSACKGSGVQFFSTPTKPVHSLAYEWGHKYPIEINYYRIGANNYVSEMGTRNPPYPPGVSLVMNGASRADVLVTFNYPIGKEHLSRALDRQGLIGYELTVTDQRNNSTLARLRYFTDLSNNKACGPTDNGVLSVMAFVLKAIETQ
ncbi:hypothetical protein [Candidatus Accumulibacter vicinus]|uniref:Transmembrane protein n=1 Tax=Candidatus Accumulibacter vicinus TaxID=2954382 RepID=A0A084XU88_9PROT|nr:hypothetical protein [Candidatus Accumulibacter vicinus]KFB66032.1 MAG: hypothetical protein CAPSK01_004875 [Candidatus Accumulibacter vicinus]